MVAAALEQFMVAASSAAKAAADAGEEKKGDMGEWRRKRAMWGSGGEG